jgi:TonB family protein
MQMLQCVNCAKLNGFKRSLGVGTVLMVLLTAGFWILAMPFYPKRCIVCGFDSDDRPSKRWNNAAVLAAILIFVGLVAWYGSRRGAVAPHDANPQPVDSGIHTSPDTAKPSPEVLSAERNAEANVGKPSPMPAYLNPDEPKPDPSPLLVSSDQIVADYGENELMADAKYKGKKLEVYGMVIKIREDADGKAFFVLSNYFDMGEVTALLEYGEEGRAATLRTGEIAHMVCQGGGMIMGRIAVGNCKIKSKGITPAPGEPYNLKQVYQVGGDVSAPQVISGPRPELSEEAFRKGIYGKVIIHCVIDQEGNPHGITVTQPMGMGVDENVVRAIQATRFQAATQHGIPVPVEWSITVNFQAPESHAAPIERRYPATSVASQEQ